MSGSIQLNYEILDERISQLNDLLNNEEITAALEAVVAAKPVISIGSSATVVASYEAQLRSINSALLELLNLTISVLRNASDYFTMTDDELSTYLSQLGIS